MSRCFPYPPPGYIRNGAAYEALIESIKLQKETNKTKTERKKETRVKREKKEKRHKEKQNNVEEIKLQKNTNGDSHKVLHKAADCSDALIKGTTDATTELFEKSDLTEEHGPSIGSHQPSYSSDSTQNSNKRKRESPSVLPDSSTAHGKPIKIRFLKKHKESDSSNFVTDTRTNLYPSIPSSFNSDRSVISSIRFNGVPATSEKENLARTTPVSDLNRSHFGRIQSAPSTAKPQQPSISSFGRQVVPQIHSERVISNSSVSRNIDETQQLASNKPSTSAEAGERPSNDGDRSHKKLKEDVQKVIHTRFEKKILKKHAKYEKLVGSWLPPVVQSHLPDVDGDEDWLSGSKASNSSISKVEVETCRLPVAPWQPCARFLTEVDIHVLPYTVPF